MTVVRARVSGAAAVLAAALLTSSCTGSTESGDPGGLAGDARANDVGDEPVTPRAMAAVALEHLPDDTRSRRRATAPVVSPGSELSIELRYPGDSGSQLVQVTVTPDQLVRRPKGEPASAYECRRRTVYGGCEQRQVPGGTLFYIWTSESPEEDPGGFTYIMRRDPTGNRGREEWVRASWSLTPITRDPRTMDLPFPVEAMEAVVRDARLGQTTTAALIDAGEALPGWDGR